MVAEALVRVDMLRKEQAHELLTRCHVLGQLQQQARNQTNSMRAEAISQAERGSNEVRAVGCVVRELSWR